MSLTMEAERKKRKITYDNEEDEDEDLKMERFFALIRSAKDIRDRLLDKNDPVSPPPPPPPPPQPRQRRRPEKNKEPIAPSIAAAPVIPQPPSSEIERVDLSLKPDLITSIDNNKVADSGSGKRRLEEEEAAADRNNRSKKAGRIILDLNLSL